MQEFGIDHSHDLLIVYDKEANQISPFDKIRYKLY